MYIITMIKYLPISFQICNITLAFSPTRLPFYTFDYCLKVIVFLFFFTLQLISYIVQCTVNGQSLMRPEVVTYIGNMVPFQISPLGNAGRVEEEEVIVIYCMSRVMFSFLPLFPKVCTCSLPLVVFKKIYWIDLCKFSVLAMREV